MFIRKNRRPDVLRTFPNFNFHLKKNGVTSGASRLSYQFKRKLPITLVSKHLSVIKVNTSGRINSGRVGVFTKSKRRFKKRLLSLSYSFRLRFISFIGNIIILPFTHRLISVLFLSTGSITHIPTSHHHKLLTLVRMYRVTVNLRLLWAKQFFENRHRFIQQSFFIIKQLNRNRPISSIEVLPGVGIQYVRAPATSAFITKKNYQLNTALVRLPSGVRKVFSLLSLGSSGPNPLVINKYWKSGKAGYYRDFGKKSRVRGVAKNPTDHPHGGRTKSISYPRTPWGHTTKFK